MYNIRGSVRPWVLVWSWMEEVYIYMDKEEYSTIVFVLLHKSSYWVIVLRSMGMYPVCWCISDGF